MILGLGPRSSLKEYRYLYCLSTGNIVYTCDNTEMTERDKGIERERERDRE